MRRIPFSYLAISIAVGFVLYGYLKYRPLSDRNQKIISWDVTSYYYYLPAYLLYQDPGVEGDFGGINPAWFHGPKGKPGEPALGKMTMGLAYLYSPFFVSGHLYAKYFTDENPNGFSPTYDASLLVGGYIMFFIGLFFLRRFLREYFPDWMTAVLILLYLFGTNLWVNVVWKPANPHLWLFSLVAISLWVSHLYISRGKARHLWLLGLLLGEITLIRPTDAIIALAIGLFVLISLGSGKRTGKFWKTHVPVALIFFCIPILPQLYHWNLVTGHWVYYSYGEEGFYWLDSKIRYGLFSFRKGWFIYSPAMLFVIPGFIRLFKINRRLFHSILWPFLISMYVMFAWWCWWYGGSYGMRPMIEWMPLLALPMGYGLMWLFSGKWLRLGTMVISLAFCYHSFFMSGLFMNSILHWNAMSFQAMKELYLTGGKPTPEYQNALCPPPPVRPGEPTERNIICD